MSLAGAPFLGFFRTNFLVSDRMGPDFAWGRDVVAFVFVCIGARGFRGASAHRCAPVGLAFLRTQPKNFKGFFPGARISAYPALRPNREDAPNPKTGSHFCVPAKLPKKPICRDSHFCVLSKSGGLAFLRTPPWCGSHFCVPQVGRLFGAITRQSSASQKPGGFVLSLGRVGGRFERHEPFRWNGPSDSDSKGS